PSSAGSAPGRAKCRSAGNGCRNRHATASHASGIDGPEGKVSAGADIPAATPSVSARATVKSVSTRGASVPASGLVRRDPAVEAGERSFRAWQACRVADESRPLLLSSYPRRRGRSQKDGGWAAKEPQEGYRPD